MISISKAIVQLAISVVTGASSRRLAFAMLMVCLGSTNAALAVPYTFLTVASTGALTSQFTGPNGAINVSHVFSAGGQGGDDNNNALIFPSTFTTLFPGTGQVQGHLAQTVYNHTSVVTFDLTGYALSSSTVFGMWNTTVEVAQPAYRVELIDAANTAVPPTTFNLIGNQNNTTQVAAKHRLLLNTSNGDITFGALLNPSGIHTDAAFWNNIPVGTKKIIVYGNLPPLNDIGDGVGYYFAEIVPEPATAVLLALGIAGMSWIRKRRLG